MGRTQFRHHLVRQHRIRYADCIPVYYYGGLDFHTLLGTSAVNEPPDPHLPHRSRSICLLLLSFFNRNPSPVDWITLTPISGRWFDFLIRREWRDAAVFGFPFSVFTIHLFKVLFSIITEYFFFCFFPTALPHCHYASTDATPDGCRPTMPWAARTTGCILFLSSFLDRFSCSISYSVYLAGNSTFLYLNAVPWMCRVRATCVGVYYL